jgi:PRTRC genetic system protein B
VVDAGGVPNDVLPFDRRRYSDVEPQEVPASATRVVRNRQELWVRAMLENARPKPTTKLRVAPYFAVLQCKRRGWPDRQGTMRSPEDAGVATIPHWEQAFFQSEFTHQTGSRRLTSHPGGFLGLWASLSGSRKPFPIEHLAPANETLLEFAARESRLGG